MVPESSVKQHIGHQFDSQVNDLGWQIIQEPLT